MNSGRTILKMSVLLFLILAGPTVGYAGVIADVANYFKPVTGTLVAIQGDDYLINLDASTGVMVGDLLSIVTPGENLIDPDTGTLLGTLDTVKGVLKVTKVRSGFSQASPLGTISNAQKGDSVRRYQNLAAIFTVQKESDLGLYERLTLALPSLEWQGAYHTSTSSDHAIASAQLTFALTASALKVHDSSGQLLRSFATTVQTSSALSTQDFKGSASGVSSPLSTTSATVSWNKSNQRNQTQITYSADYPGFRTLGELSGLVVAAEVTSNNNQILVATSDGAELHISDISNQMKLLSSVKNQQQGKIHALAWWQPGTDTPLYLAVTTSSTKSFSYNASAETIFVSSIYRFSDNQLVAVAEKIPYLLGTFDQNGDGVKETLLAQKFDLDTVFGPIRELILDNSGYAERSFDRNLPRGFPVQGSIFADLTGDGNSETIYTRRGILYIISNGKLLYESAKQMGGSLSRLTYNVNPGQADTLFTTVAFEVPQVAADIDGDGQLELIAVSANRSAFSAPGLDFGGSESWLSVIKYKNNRFVKGTLGEKLEQPIQGLAVRQGRALIVLSRKDSILNGEGQSHLLALPLTP